MLKKNLLDVQTQIQNACLKSDRKEDDVTLIAVSKTKPIPMLEEVYDAGIRHFGENKVQELVEKYEILPKDIKWHMIGHLQRNKVKYIVDKVYMIHSVDTLRLAEEISKEAKKKNVTVKILIEVNIAKETTKYGIQSKEELIQMIKDIAALDGLKIEGLMCIAPYVENSEENRPYFVELRQLSVDISQENIDNVTMKYLSMGMTNDYVTAIEEGANFVRVGTGIFGERDYSNR